MDAVKYLKEYDRMCKSYGSTCKNCEIDKLRNGCEGCSSIVHAHPEKVVAIVEKWSAENPVKTRQSEFLKLFPNAEFNTDGILTIAPCLVDKTFNMSAGSTEECCVKNDCIKCRKEYWHAEVG